jgi:hypothetical protein
MIMYGRTFIKNKFEVFGKFVSGSVAFQYCVMYCITCDCNDRHE